VNGTLIVGTLIVMFIYSWQLTLLTLVAYAPVIPLFRAFQRRQLQAYDEERTAIGDMIAEFSETVSGAAVIRAYGLQDRARIRLRERIDRAYRARVRAAKYFAAMFPSATSSVPSRSPASWWPPRTTAAAGTGRRQGRRVHVPHQPAVEPHR
jgi:ABC-type multidrug transport system fused ATPase/permease subunit